MHKSLKLKHLIVVAGFAPLFAFAQAGDADKTAAIKELLTTMNERRLDAFNKLGEFFDISPWPPRA